MGFAERMRAFTDEVHECASARAAEVADVRAEAARLLGNARSFMGRTFQEHRERADEVRTALADGRRQREDHMRDFRGQVARSLHELRQQLHQMLAQDRQQRHTQLGELRAGFQQFRSALAGDLHEAGRIWRNRTRR